MIVRLATPKDFKEIVKLFSKLDEIHTKYRKEIKEKISLDRYKSIINDSYLNPNKVICVLEENNLIIGFAIGFNKITKNHLLYKDNIRGYVNYFLIDEKHRNIETARLLFFEIEKHLVEKGAQIIELEVYSFNKKVLLLIEKVGGYTSKIITYEKRVN
jgi:ribosomal protein S18 acetylase RimI-like enzyme|tara:strand:+ start:8889 stop:9362 length:474 start_codon:yes stop_codon:yes gene_type:complete